MLLLYIMERPIEIIVAIIFVASFFVGPISASQNSRNTTRDLENIPFYEEYAPFESAQQGYTYYASDSDVYGSAGMTQGENFYAQDYQKYGNDTDASTGYRFYLQDNKDYPINYQEFEYDSDEFDEYTEYDESQGYNMYSRDARRYGNYNDVSDGHGFYLEDNENYSYEYEDPYYDNVNGGYGFYVRDNQEYPIEYQDPYYDEAIGGYGFYLRDTRDYPLDEDLYQYRERI